MATQGYSDAELTNAAASVVQSDVSVKHDALGPLDLENQFQETKDLLASTLVNDPYAAFYLFYLLCNRLKSDAAILLQEFRNAIGYVQNTRTRVSKIKNTTLLGDAAVALSEISAVLSTEPMVQQQAYSRYVAAIDQFRDESLAPNMTAGQTIIPSLEENKRLLGQSVQYIIEHYDDVLNRFYKLFQFMDEFLGLDLTSASAMIAITQARKDLQSMQDVFEDTSTTDADKNAATRLSYLQMAAGKAVISNLRGVVDPRLPLMNCNAGSGQALYQVVPSPTDPDTVIAEPSFIATASAPWKLSTINNSLTVNSDGRTTQTYSLPTQQPPYVVSESAHSEYHFYDWTSASLTSTLTTYDIPDEPGNILTIIVDGAVFSCALTIGTGRLASDIITDLGSVPGLSAVLTVDSVGGHLRFTTVQQSSNAGIIVRTMNDVLGFVDTNAYSAGHDWNRRFYVDGASYDITAGTYTTQALVTYLNTVLVGHLAAPEVDGNRIRIIRTDGYCTITLKALAEVGLRCYEELGFKDEQSANQPAVSAKEVADLINAQRNTNGATASVEFTFLGACSGPLSFSGTNQVFIPAGTGSFSDIWTPVLANYQLINAGGQGVLYVLDVKAGPNQGRHRLTHMSTDLNFVADPENPFVTDNSVVEYSVVLETVRLTSVYRSPEAYLSPTGTACTPLRVPAGPYRGSIATTAVYEDGVSRTEVWNSAVKVALLGVGADDYVDFSDSYETADVGARIAWVEQDVMIVLAELLAMQPNVTIRPCRIFSWKNKRYYLVIQHMTTWREEVASSIASWPDIGDLLRYINPILDVGQPSEAQINDADRALTGFEDAISTGYSYLWNGMSHDLGATPDFPMSDRADAALNMLRERGFDLAFEKILLGDLAGFFSMDMDDASSSASMLKAAREVVQNDVPVSKTEEDADVRRTHQSTVYSPDAAYDYSDKDQADPVNLVGEGVIVDEDDPAADQVTGKSLSG